MGIAHDTALELARCVIKFSINGMVLTLGRQDILFPPPRVYRNLIKKRYGCKKRRKGDC